MNPAASSSLAGATCIVAGASGFLGRRLAELLLEQGAQVRALVRATSEVNLPPAIPILRCELADAERLANLLSGGDFLFNCIGHSSDWGTGDEFREGNIESVKNLWQAAHRARISHIVHVSSTDVYGYPRVACDESHPLVEVGLPYNRSKIAGERCALALGRELQLNVSIVRPATIFGPRCHDWVVEFGRQLQEGFVVLPGGGRTNAGMIFVDDVAFAMIGLAATGDRGGVYNLTDPTPVTWKSYTAQLCDALGVAPPWGIPRSLALAIAWCSEAVWQLRRANTRPLLTRHVCQLMSRDQHFPVARLRSRDSRFPPVGLLGGLAATRLWIEGELRTGGGKFPRRGRF